jgi:manganese catalase
MPVLEDVLLEQMQDLLHAESQLVKALPKMAKAAKSPKLKQAFETHTEETREHVERLRQAFELVGAKAKVKPCRGMQGLIEEGSELIAEGKGKDEIAADLALAAAAQKIEHYEISGYGTVRTIAEQLGEQKLTKLFAKTLSEEERADRILTGACTPLLKEASQGAEEIEQ